MAGKLIIEILILWIIYTDHMAVLAQKLIQSRKRQYIKVMHRLFFVQNNALETFVVVVLAGP